MKRLGKVLHKTGVKNLIIRGDEVKPENVSGSLPKLNSVVVDKALNRIGTIVSVFGPVNHPFFLVKGFKKTPDSEVRALINERVYIR
jgi:RNA-binding protein